MYELFRKHYKTILFQKNPHKDIIELSTNSANHYFGPESIKKSSSSNKFITCLVFEGELVRSDSVAWTMVKCIC